ncbi:MAG: Rrf2 family transcriptional regulator [Planctomycetia bacterium]|nr:Rrf2 family transcriptional regulator [Planctomycetia bacterium]
MLSKSGKHAVRAMAVLANLGQSARADVSSISREINAPKMYLSKVMRRLSQAGLLNGRKGRGGGYRLTRRAECISMFEVLEPFEHFGEATSGASNGPLMRDMAARRDPCETIQFRYLSILHEISLAEIAIDAPRQLHAIPAAPAQVLCQEVCS